MKQYRNLDTGEIWTEDEIKKIYESEYNLREAYSTFAEYMNYLLNQGGIVEAYWYAVMRDCDDQDWGYGSYVLDEAKEMCEKYPEGYIAVIDNNTDNPVCIEEMHQDEF